MDMETQTRINIRGDGGNQTYEESNPDKKNKELEEEKQRSIIKSNPNKKNKNQRKNVETKETKCMRKKEPCRRFLEPNGVPLDSPGFVVFAEDGRGFAAVGRCGIRVSAFGTWVSSMKLEYETPISTETQLLLTRFQRAKSSLTDSIC